MRVRPGKFLPLAFDVAAVSGVTVRELLSKSRRDFVIEARQAFYLALHRGGWTFREIGRVLGLHRTTVMHGVDRAADDEYITSLAEEALEMFRAKEGGKAF